MPIVTFETPDGDDIEIDTDEVVALRAGDEEGTSTVELDDGSEVTVVATPLEAAADLGLDPQDLMDEIADQGDDEEIED